MKKSLTISPGALQVITELQNAGYETYVVGGAIRDLLLGRHPKDFDISTSATPEETRAVFGRRQSRIIGRRFRLTHVFMERELFEVSTFRKAPRPNAEAAAEHFDYDEKPENMILSDNSYGTSQEDAQRRDFTVNALFYDPIKEELIDYTGMGLKDIESGTVRAIGDPALRFEEDPVRMLRALKLVAQYDFSLDAATENALFSCLPLLHHASESRLTLELEKILESTYGDRHLEVFHDYGLLPYFLSRISKEWGSAAQKAAVDLLYERNCRVDSKLYRNSISLALAAFALPFVENALHREIGTLWEAPSPEVNAVIEDVVNNLFAPQNLMIRMRDSACRILQMQWHLQYGDHSMRGELMRRRSYSHARELLAIRAAGNEELLPLLSQWPQGHDKGEREVSFFPRKKTAPAPASGEERPKRRHRGGRRHRRPDEKFSPRDAMEEL